jgi:hypothetical protein
MRPITQPTLGPMELNPVGRQTPTEPNRLGDWRATVGKSLGRACISQKVAATDLGVTESALSKQLAGAEHLSFWRMRGLPAPFWQELVLLIIDFYGLQIGMSEQDRRDCELGRTMREAVQRSLAR